MFTATRLTDSPLITRRHFIAAGAEGGNNINGPSLIRKPDWIDAPGRYWLYFAHHHGQHIRLATADALLGPYTLVPQGTLSRLQTHFNDHIASPDVHVDAANRRLILYYHGALNTDPPRQWSQVSCVAFSTDGMHFVSERESLSPSYLRVFGWRGQHYGIAMPGILFRSDDGLTHFEQGPCIIPEDARHFATLVRGDVLHLFYSIKGDCPERIVHRPVQLADTFAGWTLGEKTDILRPERSYEGVNAPHIRSENGAVREPSYQLRDPCIFEEDGVTYLLYAVAGESGIAIARLDAA